MPPAVIEFVPRDDFDVDSPQWSHVVASASPSQGVHVDKRSEPNEPPTKTSGFARSRVMQIYVNSPTHPKCAIAVHQPANACFW